MTFEHQYTHYKKRFSSLQLFHSILRLIEQQITFKQKTMLVTTTPTIEGKQIITYYGIVSGETIIGANVFRDLFASIRDIVGGRSGSYEEVLREAKETALLEMQQQASAMGANAVIGVDLDYETVGGNGSMLMVTACGTAVRIAD